ncbi:unnamed protein product [Sphagnum jensenii]|uniref:Uncharacterized protein n=1 Tax=Sphagnum jensenii TaxID=128206 RepID=A0ABP0WKA1_9BRYO
MSDEFFRSVVGYYRASCGIRVRKPVPGCMLKLSYFGGMFVVVTLSMWRWGDWWSDLPRSLDGDHTLLGYSHSSS